MSKKNKKEVILNISDIHLGHEMENLEEELINIKKKHKPTMVVINGDLLEHNGINFHDKDPSMPSIQEEYEYTKSMIKKIAKIFPVVSLTMGNHDDLINRKAKFIGLPADSVKTLEEYYEFPKGWKIHNEIFHKMSDGRTAWFKHYFGASEIQFALRYGMCVSQGHVHTALRSTEISKETKVCGGVEVPYWMKTTLEYIDGIPFTSKKEIKREDQQKPVWAISTGCMINKKSKAYDYAKGNLTRQQLGYAIITDGVNEIFPLE